MNAAVVVIHNARCAESPSCAALAKLKVKFAVADNSDEKNDENRLWAAENGAVYLDMNGNAGLSRAYNRAAGAVGDYDYFCLFDDDTEIPDDYFTRLDAAPRADILLPDVYDKVGLLSPCRVRKNHIGRFKSVEEVGGEYSGVNTGMAVSGEYIKKAGWNEKLFVDYVDHDFIRTARRNGAVVERIPVRLKQHFSDTEGTKSGALERFSIFARDFKEFYSDEKIYAALRLFYRRLKLSLRYRTAEFFKR